MERKTAAAQGGWDGFADSVARMVSRMPDNSNNKTEAETEEAWAWRHTATNYAVQVDLTGCTRNGEKLSSSHTEPGQAIK